MSKPKIVLEHVSKFFGPHPRRALRRFKEGGNTQVLGVHDVSLDIPQGQTFVLMGLSGSGKSTLLRLLNRLHEPTAGRILVGGTDLGRLKRKELVRFRRETFCGMVFQGFAILPYRTTLSNAAFGLELQGVPKRERLERARAALSLVGLSGRENALPRELSGGMQQRVGLARALALEGDILLMDEPFSALDPLIRRELQDELLRLRGRVEKTIVFVTHDLSEALKLGDRIAILKEGRVQQVGSPEEIVTEPANPYVASFVSGVDRTAVLTASSIMTPALETDPPRAFHQSVKPGARLSEVIHAAARSSQAVAVVDDDGQLVGTIEQGAILSALVAPWSLVGAGSGL